MSHEPHTERTNKHLLCLTKQFRSLGNGATHEPPLACVLEAGHRPLLPMAALRLAGTRTEETQATLSLRA
jgi:hypothetical protein